MHQMLEEYSLSCPARPRRRSPADTRFSVFEVLQIAEEVDRKAAGFYREAARRFVDEERRSLCRHLAACRSRRRHAWARLRRGYSVSTGAQAREGVPSCLENPLPHEVVHWAVPAFPAGEMPPVGTPDLFVALGPDDYVLSHPRVMVGLTCFATRPDSCGRLTGHETREQILHHALLQSTDLAIFYHGLKGFTAGPDAWKMIDYLVRQEGRHARLLSLSLEPIHAECRTANQSSWEGEIP